MMTSVVTLSPFGSWFEGIMRIAALRCCVGFYMNRHAHTVFCGRSRRKQNFVFCVKMRYTAKMTAFCLAVVFLVPFCLGCSFSIIENDGGDVHVDASPHVEASTATPSPVITPTAAPMPTAVVTPSPTVSSSPAPTPSPTPSPIPTEAPTATPLPYTVPTFTASPSNNVVYLTFDDGPVRGTARVLDILNSYGIKGTFFSIGQCIRVHPDIARRIVAEGHVLACHTDSHDFSIIYSSPDGFAADVAAWRSTVINAVGYDAGAYIVRFPGGTTNSTLKRQGRSAYIDIMHANGYRVYDWVLGLNDKWPGGNTDNLPFDVYLMQSYYRTLTAYGRSSRPLIFIMHDTVSESVDMLAWIIEDLTARGYTFATLQSLSGDCLN